MTRFEDLKPLKVGVQTGTTGDEVTTKLLGKSNPNIKRFESTPLALKELEAGGVDAVVADNGVALPSGTADTLALVTTMFLRLIKMIIAPLVFSTLVVGIAKMGDAKEVGRIGVKALGWFVIASVISLSPQSTQTW